MEFSARLEVDTGAAARALGYARGPVDGASAALLAWAGGALGEAARPRWVWRRFALARMAGTEGAKPAGEAAGGAAGLWLQGPDLPLPGEDIAAHLEECPACLLLAVTLGDGADRLLRATQAADMARAVVLDAAASVLAEQYADEAEGLLRAELAAGGEYLTARFSPGYGDFPLETQAALLSLLDAGRAIGLTVAAGGMMLPAKSVTAVLGVAGRPVSGRLAGCEGCALRESCGRRKGENSCG